MNPLIQSLTEGQLRTDIPSFRPAAFTRKEELANVSRPLKVKKLFHLKVKDLRNVHSS